MRHLLVVLALALSGCGYFHPDKPVQVDPNPPVIPPAPEFKHSLGFTKIDSGHGLAKGAPFTNADPKSEIPVSFDWRNVLGSDFPIRDQGQCGSCWAFATVGALDYESFIFLDKKVLFSEQDVNANNFWGCSGGDASFQYLQDHGAVLDSDCPYTESNSACPGHPPIAMKIASWANVGAKDRSPTEAELKRAIIQFGPLTVSVAVDKAFDNYQGGVMTGCKGKSANHMVILVGWNKDGWAVRNQWGESFGEKGYARMPIGCDNIGADAAYGILNQSIE